MQHCYSRILFLFFTGFLLMCGQEAAAYGWNYNTSYNVAQGRVYINAAMHESDCWSCDDDELENMTIEYSVNGGGWQTLVRDAAHYRHWGTWNSSWITLGNTFGDGPFTMKNYILTVPAEWAGKNIRLRAHYLWEDSDDYSGIRYSEYNIPTIAAPNVAFHSNGEQNNVIIDWEQQGTNGYNAGDISYQLFRNGQLLQTFDYNTTVFTDAGTTNGTKYNYQVKTIVSPLGNPVSRFEVWGNAVTAWKNPRIAFTTSYTDCDTGIWLNWAKPVLGPEYTYKITRSLRSNFSAGTYEYSNIAINDISFKDDGDLSHQKAHYYKMQVMKNGQAIPELTSEDRSIVPDLRPAVPVITLAQVGTNFQISWDPYQCANIGDFELIRKAYQGSTMVQETAIRLDKVLREWTDDQLQACNTYEYQLKATNQYASVASNIVRQAVPDDISDAFALDAADQLNPQHLFYNHDYRFKASKGFYTSYIQLTWDARYKSRIQSYYIYRKIAGSTNPRELVKVVEGGSATIWTDEFAEANTIYEYTIQGIAPCDGEQIQTLEASALGFRAPFGTVTGRIYFEGGQGVENVMVRARNTEGAAGKSLRFKDAASSIDISASSSFWPGQEGWALETWLRPDDSNADYVLYDHHQDGAGLKVSYEGGSFVLTSGTEQISIDPTGVLRTGEFNHLSVSLNTATRQIQWVVNDSVFTAQQLTDAFVRHDDLNLPLYIGNSRAKDKAYQGIIDEVRIWNKPRTAQQLVQDHSRFLVGNEPGLVAYWKLNEGFGAYSFDVSRLDRKFNENHGRISGSFEWTTTIPSEEQLANVAFTNAKGDYQMTSIQFRGSGEAFEITPMLGVHSFDPTSMQLFIGEGSLSHNGKDFKDVSSFLAKGAVAYKGTSFPVQGVQVLVDGKAILSSDNTPVMSDAKGEFEARVPIGKHVLSFVKNGHVFENGYWPAKNQPFDFQEHLRGQLEIVDTTKVLLVGRVVGGQVEDAKPLGMHLSQNNLGEVKLTLEPEKGGDLDASPLVYQKTLQLTTDKASGEYRTWIIPERFIIKEIKTTNTLTDGSRYHFGEQPILDLTLPVQHFTWEYRVNDKGVKIDSANYHFAKKFVLHTPPAWSIKDGRNNGELLGLKSMKVGEDTVDLKDMPFGAPVFKMNAEYQYPLSFFEQFENADDHQIKQVPITNATVRIVNQWKQGSQDETFPVSNPTGTMNYKFKAGSPNLNGTYKLNMTAAIKVGELPYTNLGLVPGYVLGSVTSGAGFVTKGPSVVEFVLRDPPGTGSYAYLSKGSSMTRSMSVSRTDGSTQSIGAEFELGLKTTTSAGVGVEVETEFEAVNTISASETISEGHTNDGEFVETIDVTENWETSSSPDFVGSKGDLFVGSAMNFIIGKTENLELLPLDIVQDLPHTQQQLELNGKTYVLARRQGIAAAKDNYGTRFMYTKFHIEEKVIPELKRLRNQLLIRPNSIFVSKLSPDDVNFGKDNYDSLAFPTTFLPKPREGVSSIAKTGNLPSYSFNPPRDGYIDSVFMYNQQISLWEKALGDNESNKVIARDRTPEKNNVSYDGGTNYNWEKSMTSEWSTAHTFEVTSDLSLSGAKGFNLNSFGLTMSLSAEYNHALSGSAGEGEANSMTFGYVLSDGDEGDYYSVDVIDPSNITFTGRSDDRVNWEDFWELKNGRKGIQENGFFSPIFYTRGGQTMCPYEGEETTRYYQPGKVLNAATMRREVPRISVEKALVTNVPENNAAVFKIRLENLSETEADDIWMGVQVQEGTNKDGAIVTIDGTSANRAFHVPYGEVVEKTLTIRKGPGAVFDYENIGIILHSMCERDDVADTVALSAYFTPACTPVVMQAPLDNWLANIDANGKVPVRISGYDVNLESFKSIEIQYKSTASNTWATIQTFYNREEDYNQALADDKNAAVAKIDGKTTIHYEWLVTDLPDRDYEIRAKSLCADGTVSYSEVRKGLKDVTPPLVFGAPQPADGILSPNDEIMIQFAEPVEAGLINKTNISVRGVLNGSELAHGAFLQFDGKQSQVRIPQGLQLNNKSFTVEFWAKTDAAGTDRVIFTQGEGEATIHLGLTAAGKLFAEWTGQPRVVAGKALPFDAWQHYAVSFDLANGKLNLYGNDQLLAEAQQAKGFEGQGAIYVGKASAAGSAYQGGLYGLRVWDIYRSRDEVYATQSKKLNSSERGLVGSWLMNDLKGSFVKDMARALHGESTAQWVAEPASKALELSGDAYLKVPVGHAPVTKNGDFTLEFWLKGGASARETTLFSAALPATDMKWALDLDSKGAVYLKQKDLLFKGVDQNVLDDKWHHLAMTVDRRGNLSFYLDGQLQNYRKADVLTRLTAPHLYFGVRYDQEADAGGTPRVSLTRHFQGKLDEIRFWNSARTVEQIGRGMNTRQAADLADLQLYYPFESYQNNSGVMLSVNSDKEHSGKTTDVAAMEKAVYTADSPLINRPQPEQKVDFNFVVNGDKILIHLNEPPALVEKTILDVTVQGIMDQRSNVMQGARTWSVFVDKNQVKWVDSNLRFEKELYAGLTFPVEIVNMGGTQESFSIEGLPGWLTAVPASGTVEPNSRQTITFRVEESLNIGNYKKDIFLRTDFGFDEKLALDLKVFAPAPVWTVNPASFDKSMSVIGQVKINDYYSTNPDDKVAAYVNGELRGVAQLKYVAGYDRYMFFMDVYGHVNEVEKVKFNIWNATLGVVHTDVKPIDVTFRDGEVYGSPATPFVLTANNEVYQDIALQKGWNWISFNVDVKSKSLDQLLDPAVLNQNSILMDQAWTADYSMGQWSPPGKQVRNTASYLLKVDQEMLLKVKGGLLNPANEIITLKKGWNWVGYTPQASMPVKDALAGVKLANGDLIKSQSGFAIYDEHMGWIGSLAYLRSGEGYRIKSSQPQDLKFVYPKASVNAGGRFATDAVLAAINQRFSAMVQPAAYRHNMNLVAAVDGAGIEEGTVILARNDQGAPTGWGIGYEVDGQVLFFLTLYGNQENENLLFSYFDGEGHKLAGLQERMPFRSEQVTGSLDKPFRFTLAGKPAGPQTAKPALTQVYPNPFSDQLTVEWHNDPQQQATIELLDVTGRRLQVLWQGQAGGDRATFVWQPANQQAIRPGLYLLRLTQGSRQEIIKVIKK